MAMRIADDTKRQCFFLFCLCFIAGHCRLIWALLPNRLPHSFPTNANPKKKKYFQRVTSNINYIALAQEINYAFSMEIYYFIRARYCIAHTTICIYIFDCLFSGLNCMKTVLKCRQFVSCIYLMLKQRCSLVRINLVEIEFWNAFRDM